ncbi:MAG TPA: methyl-accepting chemotaxis protein [Steroidobacteraceae bacterium]|nr:methyl-accepting chemotaxis protein [Steroidobacteraceae bacterium]
MKLIRDARLGPKLLLGFLLMLAFAGVIGFAAITQLGRVEAEADRIATDALGSVYRVSAVSTNATQSRQAALEELIQLGLNYSAEAEAGKKALIAIEAQRQANAAAYEKLIRTPEQRALWTEVSARWDVYKREQDRAISVADDGLAGDAQKVLIGLGKTKFDAVESAVRKLMDFSNAEAERARLAASAAASRARRTVLVLLALAAAIGCTIAFTMTRAITRPLQATVALLREIGGGRLDNPIETTRRDEVGELLTGLATTQAEMASMVVQVKAAAEEVARSAAEISQGNESLSQRTESQAASLEETAASMEQLTSTVRQNADNARQANDLAIEAQQRAEAGSSVVARAVQAMDGINGAARRIADITGVIDEIAFQTNLLALNAAVEAARAGEQGRGFAVVANEVRTLASRSAEAAKEIKALIQDSVARVTDGTQVVNESGATFGQLVLAVKKVGQIIAEIADASGQQATGIDQVGGAVSKMDEMTQQNVALVEEAAAASRVLADQSANLRMMMSRYRLAEEPARSSASPRTVSAPARAVGRSAVRAPKVASLHRA